MTGKIVEIEGSRLANFLHFQRDPLGFMTSINEMGDIVSLRSTSISPSYVLNAPEAIREVLIVKEHAFRKGRTSRILKETVGEGILTTEGKKHDRQRQAMLPAFNKMRIQEYSQTIIDQTLNMLDQWRIGERRLIHTDFMRLTLTNIIQTMFGRAMNAETDRIGKAVEVAIQYSASRIYSPIPIPKWLPFRGNVRHTRAMQVLHGAARQFLDLRLNGKESTPLLSHLQQNGEIEDKEVIDQMITMLIAGHETTANALCWTSYLLSMHPEIEEKWREEIDQVIGKRLPTYEDIPQLNYTQLIWQEALRLYPPAWMILREANEEVELLGQRFSPNSIFMICPYSLHRNSRFFEEPEAFKPERFAPENIVNIPRHSFLPFGAGSRSCIGNQFATMEALLVLVLIAQRFRLELAPKQHPIQPEPSVSLRMKNGLRMIIKK